MTTILSIEYAHDPAKAIKRVLETIGYYVLPAADGLTVRNLHNHSVDELSHFIIKSDGEPILHDGMGAFHFFALTSSRPAGVDRGRLRKGLRQE